MHIGDETRRAEIFEGLRNMREMQVALFRQHMQLELKYVQQYDSRSRSHEMTLTHTYLP